MISPQITKRIIDEVIVGGKQDLLNKLLIGILIIGVGKCVFQYAKEFTFDVVSSKIASEIREHLFQYIQGLSISFFDKNNTGELMARVKDDVDKIWNALGFVGMLIIEVVIHTSIIIYCMFYISPKLSVIPLIAMPIVAMIAVFMELKLGSIYEDISEENAVLNTVAEENLAGVRTVKAFAREGFEIKKFLSHNKKYYELNMKQSKVLVKFQPYITLITKLLPIAVITYGGYLVILGDITLGDLAAFTQYSMNIVWPMEMLGWLTNDFSSALASTKKLRAVYSNTSEIRELETPVHLEKISGEIDFEHVDFRQGNKIILEDISFHLEAGKTLGIMGATGTGKTSIINLMQRFYEATDGMIKLDGKNIKELYLEELRNSISLVMQDVFLFSDTITENVNLGKKDTASRENMIEALADAQAKGFIERMDQQYDTIIGERGVGLSGGQKQRISIARAFAKKTPILILDDSTSALDMETEHLIQQTLSGLTETTKIIIAHRISAVKNADEIIILDQGRIVERGIHEELIAKRGYYYKTYKAQYGEILEEYSSQEVRGCL